MLSITTSKKFYDKYLFDINDYKIDEEIVGGSFGRIRIVRNLKNDKIYVTKTNTPKNPQYKLYISREINILIRIQHETMVPFRGFSYIDFDKRNNLTILMDYMKNGSLANFIKDGISDKCPEFTPTIRQIILIGIARGMMLLHKLNVIHRDLKPDNILLDSNLHPHITDFGLSKFFDKNKATEQTQSGLGTLLYMAPEVMDDSIFDIKADVYSFGILMYEVVTGKSAFGHLGNISALKLYEKVKNGARPIIKKGTVKQKGLRVMMKMCWDENPQNRPSFSEIFKKLSLSTNDFLLGFENNPEKEIINIYKEDADDDADEIAKEEDKAKEMEKKGINTRFCLDDVDYDQVSRYVEEILVEPKNIKDEEMKDLKKEIFDLKEITKSQASLIEQLQKSKKKKEKTIDDDDDDKVEINNLKLEINELKEITKSQASLIEQLQKSKKKKEKTIDDDDDDKVEINDLKLEINELKEVTKCQAVLIEQLHKSKKQKEMAIDNDKEEINDLKNEVISLKKRSKSQNKLIKQLQLSNENKDDEEIENLKKEVKDLKKQLKNHESITSSNSSQFQDILDSVMENVGLMNKKQQEMIKQQQEKIDQQEETIRQQKEKIEQQQIDIMNQFEIFKKQIKELSDKLDKKNSEESKKETITDSNEQSDDDDDEKIYIDQDQIIERKPKHDSDDERIPTTDSDAEQKAESDSNSDEENKSSSNSDNEKESSSSSDNGNKDDDDEPDINYIYKTNSDSENEIKDENSEGKKSEGKNSENENSEDEDEESKIKYKLIKSIKYDSIPKGILSFLEDKVFISAGGNSANVNCIRSIAGSGFNNWVNFKPSNESESFIEFDFGTEFRVELEFYLIHPYKQYHAKIYPRSWQIIGSNDQSKWVILDEKEDELTLKNNIAEQFYCQNNDRNNKFRYIRFVQSDSWSPSNNMPYYVSISFFELFGDIYRVE